MKQAPTLKNTGFSGMSGTELFGGAVRVTFMGQNMVPETPLWKVLCGVEGIGRKTAHVLCQRFNLAPNAPIGALRMDQLAQVEEALEAYGPYWAKEQASHLRDLFELGLVRAGRLRKGLPVRGQRTKTNARRARRSKARSRLTRAARTP